MANRDAQGRFVAGAGSFREKDNGADTLVKTLVKMSLGHSVKVGLLDGGEEQEEGGPLTVLQVATFHEFGLGVPERSFIRAWYDENLERNKADFRAQMRRVTRGEVSEEQAFQQLGAKWAADIQARIRSQPSDWEPLKQATKDRKGSDLALIDTGQLVAAISYEVS